MSWDTPVLHALFTCRGGCDCCTRVLPHRVPTRVNRRVHTVHAPTRVVWAYTRLAKFRDVAGVAKHVLADVAKHLWNWQWVKMCVGGALA